MGDDTTPGQGLMEMILPEACMDKHKGRRLRSQMLTEIHDTAQLGIIPEICIMVFRPRAIYYWYHDSTEIHDTAQLGMDPDSPGNLYHGFQP